MEQYIDALTTSIVKSFPNDIIEHIYNTICSKSGSKLDLNTLWPSFYNVNNVSALATFIKLGANVNHASSEYGSTPILFCAQNGFSDMVNLLIEAGADITIKNKGGNDIYYYAKQGGINIDNAVKLIKERKEKEELMKKNQVLEGKCVEMDQKLNYLMGIFSKMELDTDLAHKKCKAIGSGDN
ncbi:MAG: hypothetical protein Barrevirus1_8 [Barrevirus sp.]|uniref:Uncharacterized protein n=1 Tax=Barrevirus sp. TaxID=2487763 RepID=A0A3G4ZPH3_9VIRU|nr:MAG: hypothetical protein Barrevirus1_8 [Barrevirus sp.]